MPDGAYAVLREAILNEQQVTCVHNGYHRELCPHVLGIKNGREQVLSFQFAGESSRGLPPGGEWRCMRVQDIQNAELRDGPWHTSQSHTQPQTCVDEIDVEVSY